MPYPTIEQSMKLLAAITGWSSQSLGVDIGYKEAKTWDADQEPTLHPNNWGWVVSTTICSKDTFSISAQGKSLEEALWRLALEVERCQETRAKQSLAAKQKANTAIDQFRKEFGL